LVIISDNYCRRVNTQGSLAHISQKGEGALKNIDQFNEAVGLIFATLYESFPKRVELSSGKIAQKIDDFDYRQVSDTIFWLSKYGYISVGRPMIEASYSHCTLTPLGLQLLNAVPDSLKEKPATYGELLSDAVKDTALEQGKKGLGELAAKAIAYGVTSLGNLL